MRLSNFLLLFFHIIVISPLCAQADVNNHLTTYCDTANSTSSSFDSDLSRLFSSLTNNTPSSGYSTSTVGQSGNKIYGAAMCQAGTFYTDCNTCLNTAISNIFQMCAKKVNATTWYDDCMLRYSNSEFFTSIDNYK
jgi:Salt stress response/antifungal